MKRNSVRLGVNIDHIATLRNARGEGEPKLNDVALILQKCGVNSITIHLREDRRHIKDNDLRILKKSNFLPLNLEMAATEEMMSICLDTLPYACCIVPEKRQELTTEGGLDVLNNIEKLQKIISPIIEKNVRLSLFVDPDINQIDAARELGVKTIEINTGKYANFFKINKYSKELKKIYNALNYATELGIECHAGHGLNLKNLNNIVALGSFKEFNIGFSIVCESIFFGLENSIKKFQNIIQ